MTDPKRMAEAMDVPPEKGSGGFVRAADGRVLIQQPECCLPAWVVEEMKRATGADAPLENCRRATVYVTRTIPIA